jgi:hypothetical protein
MIMPVREIGKPSASRPDSGRVHGVPHMSELAELFSVSRPTVYRVLERAHGTSTSVSAGNVT